MDALQRSRALARVGLLRHLPAEGVAALASSCQWRHCRSDQEVISQDSDNKDVFFVIQGCVRVTIFASGGREIAFRDLSAGASFGELAAIDGLARSASVVALADSVLASLSRERFWAMLRAEPVVTERVLRNLAALVRSLTERVVDYGTLGVRNRIQAELVRMAREAGVERNRAVIAPMPRHADIASRVATNREAVARELNRLAREGLVERRRGALGVLDVARLVAIVDQVRNT